MTRRPRRNNSPAFKAKVALASVRAEQTLVECEHPVSGFCRSGKSGDVLALEPALVLTLIPDQRGYMARMEIMSGTERRRRRRRRWSDEAKLRILAEADQPGVRIGDVARRHDIYPSQIRLWRQSFSYVGRPAMFLPVEITEEVSATQAPDTPPTPAVEISLRNGRCLGNPPVFDGAPQ